jgi:hypothetical protein
LCQLFIIQGSFSVFLVGENRETLSPNQIGMMELAGEPIRATLSAASENGILSAPVIAGDVLSHRVTAMSRHRLYPVAVIITVYLPFEGTCAAGKGVRGNSSSSNFPAYLVGGNKRLSSGFRKDVLCDRWREPICSTLASKMSAVADSETTLAVERRGSARTTQEMSRKARSE